MKAEATVQVQPLKSIVPAAQNNINAKFIVVDKGPVATEDHHKTCLALVADETAAVHFQLRGDECEAVEAGDILVLKNGIFSYSNCQSLVPKNYLFPNTRQGLLMVLRAGKRGAVEKVGEFTMRFEETPNLSEFEWAPDPRAANKYVKQAAVSPYSRIFPPKR